MVSLKENRRENGLLLFLLAGLMALMIAACGGGGGGSTPSSSGSVLSGVFVDAPVEGLEYSTETQSGSTGSDGRFYYKSGETVTFKIGKLVMGSAMGAPTLTPVDLVPGAASQVDPASNPTVVNIVRIVLSLNANATTTALKIDPSVLTKAHSLADGSVVAMDDPNFSATASTVVKSLDSTKDLVSAATAIAHFKPTWQQITGATSPATGSGAGAVAGIYPISSSSSEDPWPDPLVVDSAGNINFLIHPLSYNAGKLDSSNGFSLATPSYSASAKGSESNTGSIDGTFKMTGTKTTVGSDSVKSDQSFTGQRLDFSSHPILGTWYGDFSYTSYSERIKCSLTFHADGSLTGKYEVSGSWGDGSGRNNNWPADGAGVRSWPNVNGYFYQSGYYKDIAGWIAGIRDGVVDFTFIHLNTSMLKSINMVELCTEYTCGYLTKQ